MGRIRRNLWPRYTAFPVLEKDDASRCTAWNADSAAGVFVWKYLIRPFGGIWDIYELLPVFCVSIIVNIIVSHLTYTPDPDVANDFCHYMETVKKV